MFTQMLKNHTGLQYNRTKHIVSNKTLNGIVQPQRGKLDRPGDPNSQTLQILCENCNNVFLSGIQNNAKESLIKLMEWRWNEVSKGDQRLMAIWAVSVAMVTEFDNITAIAIPESERHFLKQNLEPNENWFVWVAKAKDYPTQHGGWNTSFSISPEIKKNIIGDRRSKLCSFFAGNSFFVVFYCPLAFVDLFDQFFSVINTLATPIWPIPKQHLSKSWRIYNNAEYYALGEWIRREVDPNFVMAPGFGST